jgi:hypothetical protein
MNLMNWREGSVSTLHFEEGCRQSSECGPDPLK